MDDYLMPRDENLIVTENIEITKDIYHLRLERSGAIPDSIPAPGQFAMLKVREGASPLLRRPLSYLFADRQGVEFLYRIAGVGTRILATAGHGDFLSVMGPLGAGFDTSLARTGALLVAGGMGLPPLYYLARQLKKAGDKNIEIIHGTASLNELILSSELGKDGVMLHCATEDGSQGFRGMATELLEERLKTEPHPDVIYACGPHPMLKRVSDIAHRENIPCQVSVEAIMACGTGACMGCAIPTAEGRYVQVCNDGPVFDSRALFRGD